MPKSNDTVLDIEKLKEKLIEYKQQTETSVKDLISQESSALNETIDTLKSNIEKANESIGKINEELEKQKNLGLPGADEEKQKFSFAALTKALIETKLGKSDPWKDAGFEKEVIDEYAKKRDANSGDGSEGGYLVPEEAKGDLIDLTLAQMPIANMGVTKYAGLHGDLPIPKITSRPTAYMVSETGAPSSSDNAFGEIVLRPKKVAAFTKISRRLAYQTRGVAEQVIRNALSEAMALKFHDQLLNGIGSQNEVTGLRYATSGMTTTDAIGTNGGRFKIDKASEMPENLDEADELKDSGNYGWLMRPVVLGGMKRERVIMYSGASANAGQPMLGTNLLINNKMLEDQLGHMIRTTTQIGATETKGTSSTCSYVWFANWKMFLLGLWRDMELRVSDIASDASGNSAFLKDQIYIVAFQEFDANIARASAFTYVADAETTKSNWSD